MSFARLAKGSVERARAARNDNSKSSPSSPNSKQVRRRSTFGTSTSNHTGIAKSEKNRSLRDLVSRVSLTVKPASPRNSEPLTKVPTSFEDVPSALIFLEAEVSRTRPELLRCTSMIGTALSNNRNELIKLRRDVNSMQDQLQDQTDARAVQRKLNAIVDQLEHALADAAGQREDATKLREEVKELQMKLRSSQEDIANETRTMRRDISTSKTGLRQKETEVDTLKQTNLDLLRDIEDLKRANIETEESCNDMVKRTQESAEEDRQALKTIKEDMKHMKKGSRKDKTEHQFESTRTAREMEDLKEEVSILSDAGAM